MIKIYDASNGVEAHMVLDLLERSGINGRIDGEYLQGGVGELQAIGLVRVLVNENDIDKAKAVIAEWDALQEQKAEPPEKRTSARPLVIFLAGLALGITAAAIFYNTPVEKDGIDYNEDGVMDEHWTYKHYLLEKADRDRNLDGNTDETIDYDRKGLAKYYKADNDFDGRYETTGYFRNGNLASTKSDIDGDGFFEYEMIYRNDLLESARFLDPTSNKPLKIQHFDGFKLTHAEMDSDKDGILETQVQYDSLEEIISVKRK